MKVKAKKHLGQHFLKDKAVCKRIADQYGKHQDCTKVLEIGPGTGALTEYLLQRGDLDVTVMDVDDESIAYLNEFYPQLHGKIHHADFLRIHPKTYFGDEPFAVVGNFPYNISSQILFQCIEWRDQIPEIMGMFQREVALRVAEKPGTKTYGILSVLLQAYYDIEYCFTVDEHVFDPPPKVKSGVIRCVRNSRTHLPCNEKLFKQVVKLTFNQRRKTIRNGLRSLLPVLQEEHPLLTERPEKCSVEQFIDLTNWVEQQLQRPKVQQ